MPGYEYHYVDDSVEPPELHSQIPPGLCRRGEPDRPFARGRLTVDRCVARGSRLPQGPALKRTSRGRDCRHSEAAAGHDLGNGAPPGPVLP